MFTSKVISRITNGKSFVKALNTDAYIIRFLVLFTCFAQNNVIEVFIMRGGVLTLPSCQIRNKFGRKISNEMQVIPESKCSFVDQLTLEISDWTDA